MTVLTGGCGICGEGVLGGVTLNCFVLEGGGEEIGSGELRAFVRRFGNVLMSLEATRTFVGGLVLFIAILAAVAAAVAVVVKVMLMLMLMLMVIVVMLVICTKVNR